MTYLPGVPNAFNVLPFGARGDGSTNDTAAFVAAVDRAALAGGGGGTGGGGSVFVPPGNYVLRGNPWVNQIGHGTAVQMTLSAGAYLLTHAQLCLPTFNMLWGSGRSTCGIKGASDFVVRVNVSSTDRTSNVATITTSAAHGVEVGDTVVVEGVTDTTFNGGWQVATVPSSTSFTYSNPGADTTSSNGTVTIPIVVLGDTAPASFGCRIDNMLIQAHPSSTNSVVVYSNLVDEEGGLQHVMVNNGGRYAIWIERSGSTASVTGPQNYFLQDIEAYVTPNVSATAVKLTGTYCATRGLDHLTTATVGATGTSTAGLDISGVVGVFSRIHVEFCDTGVLIGGRASSGTSTDRSSCVVENVTAHSSVTDVVKITNANECQSIVVMNVARSNATNSLNDATASITLTDDFLGFYATYGTSTPTRFTTSPNASWAIVPEVGITGNLTTVGRVGALVTKSADGFSWTGVYHVRGDASGGAFNVTLPPANAITGRILIVSKKDNSANAVTVLPASGADTVNWGASYALAAQGDVVILQADGTSNWDKLSNG